MVSCSFFFIYINAGMYPRGHNSHWPGQINNWSGIIPNIITDYGIRYIGEFHNTVSSDNSCAPNTVIGMCSSYRCPGRWPHLLTQITCSIAIKLAKVMHLRSGKKWNHNMLSRAGIKSRDQYIVYNLMAYYLED